MDQAIKPQPPNQAAFSPLVYNIPMYIDTHCHIHDQEYHFDPEKTLAKAHYAGVEKIIVIGTSPKDSQVAHDFATSNPGVYWTYGYHPNENQEQADSRNIKPSAALKNPSSGLSESTGLAGVFKARNASEKRLVSGSLVAVGEIGLDYHYTPYDRNRQIDLFEKMLEMAKQHNLPVIFHVREAFEDFWPIVDNAGIKNAVLHSFSDTQANLEKALEHNFYIGVNGLATFTKLPIPPLDKILLETDAPYLTPAPFRGKINEPAYIPEIARWVSEHFGVTLEEVAKVTTKNAERLFHI